MIEERRESRSSHRRSFVKKYVFRNFASLFLIKFKKIELKNFIKKDALAQVFFERYFKNIRLLYLMISGVKKMYVISFRYVVVANSNYEVSNLASDKTKD